MAAQGRFRPDLLYRLRVVPIDIPPLRERPEDVAVLVRHFAESIAASAARPTPVFSPEALSLLAARAWPGNAREVRNVVERILTLSPGLRVGPERVRPEDGAAAPAGGGIALPSQGLDVEALIDGLVRQAWDRTGGNQSAMARLLRLGRDRVRRRLARLGLAPRDAGRTRAAVGESARAEGPARAQEEEDRPARSVAVGRRAPVIATRNHGSHTRRAVANGVSPDGRAT
jgi:DNA-binding NtrC family response regulator